MKRHAVLAIAVAISVLSVLSQSPIAQDLAYHLMADRRSLFGIPNALNVLSNVPFAIVGAMGLSAIFTRTAGGTRDLERLVLEPFERRRRVFAPSAAAFVKRGRMLAGVAARERWDVFRENPSLLNDALIAASCRERGITLITMDGDFDRFLPFLGGWRHVAPWPSA